MNMADTEKSGMIRDQPDDKDAAKAELAKAIVKRVKEAHTYWSPVFKRMREDIRFAAGNQNWGDVQHTSATNLKVQANVTRAVIAQVVTRLYAKDPTVVPKRKKRIDTVTWDGTAAMLDEAKAAIRYYDQAATAAAMPPMIDPATGAPLPPPGPSPADAPLMAQDVAMNVLIEAKIARDRDLMMDRIGEVGKILISWFWDQPRPRFKQMIQAALRRAETTGVAYCRPAYRRDRTPVPEVSGQITSATERLAALQARHADLQDGELEAHEAEIQALKVQIGELQSREYQMGYSGLEFRFPSSTSIIPDMGLRSLEGFQGCTEVAECYQLTRDQVKRIYGVDLPTTAKAVPDDLARPGSREIGRAGSGDSVILKGREAHLIYEVWNIVEGTVCTVCEGYEGFLVEPRTPEDKRRGFWPWDAYIPYPVESEGDIWPLSAVQLIRSIQVEINRISEGLRQHRIANRPGMVVRRGVLTKKDKEGLASHADHQIIELEGLSSDGDVRAVLQPKPTIPIDPALYDTSELFALIQRVVGVQQADLGYVSGGTATEASIAASGRSSEARTSRDMLDEFLSSVVSGSWELLIQHLDTYTAQEIAGAGALWPEDPAVREDLLRELSLTIRAGSSGNPDNVQKQAALERLLPYIVQMPNLDPTKVSEMILGALLDDGIELADYLKPEQPSIVTMNRMSGQMTAPGNPMMDPAMQGPSGGDKGPRGERPQGGAQPAMPNFGGRPVNNPLADL